MNTVEVAAGVEDKGAIVGFLKLGAGWKVRIKAVAVAAG